MRSSSYIQKDKADLLAHMKGRHPMLFDSFEQTQITTRGATISFTKGGQGYPLLLLHGYPETHVMWHKVAPRFAEERVHGDCS